MDYFLKKIGLALLGHDDFDIDDDLEDGISDEEYDDDHNDSDEEDDVADSSNVSFGHAPNDGTYSKTGRNVNLKCDTGTNKGVFDVFLHHGDKYIDFQNQWIKIEGKHSFFLNGNTYYFD